MDFRLNVESIFDSDYLAGGGTTKDDYHTYGIQNTAHKTGKQKLSSGQVRY